MTDPTDFDLLEFVARFVGWEHLKWMNSPISGAWLAGDGLIRDPDGEVPDYLHDLNAFSHDCFPKIREKMLEHKWATALQLHCTGTIAAFIANASAREKCLALWHVLQHDDGEQCVPKSQQAEQ